MLGLMPKGGETLSRDCHRHWGSSKFR